MGKRVKRIEVPGSEGPEVEEGAEQATEETAEAQGEDAVSDEELTKAQARQSALDAQVADTKKNLVGSEKALDWSHLTLPAAIHGQINHENPDEKLPHPDDIDWSKVPTREKKILTRHGWLHRPE